MEEQNKIAIATVLAAYILESSDEEEVPKKKCRTVWTKDWVTRRQEEGCYAKLLVELRAEEPELYRNFLRMDAKQFDDLLMLVTPLIQRKDTNMRKSISAGERLSLTLRYLATGDNFRSLQYLFRIPATTISRIIPDVLDAIYEVLVDEYLQTPRTSEAWDAIACKFNELWQFPNCIGAVDGKHVVMVAPHNAGSIFYNYKGTHSIVLMGIADAEYKLLYIDVGRNGRFSDGGVFNRCTFGQALDNKQLCLPPNKPLPGRELPVPYVLVADDAFALCPNFLKPFSQRGLSMVERVYNYRLSRARRIIENVFGIMSARFRVLRKPINLSAEKTKKVTLACCVLHNYLMTTNKNNYAPRNYFDRYNEKNELILGDWRQDLDPEAKTDKELYKVVGKGSEKAEEAALYQLLTTCPKSILNPDYVQRVLLGLVQQAVEKIDRTRGLAGRLFCSLINVDPAIPYISQHNRLKEIFPQNTDAVLWLFADHTFPMFCSLLELPEYSQKVLLGLSASIGQLTESLIKYSSAALFKFLRSHPNEIPRLCKEIVKNFEENFMVDRVTHPMLNFLDILIGSGTINSVLMDEESNFADDILLF